MGPLVEQDFALAVGRAGLGDHDITPPAERCHGLRNAHQHRPVGEPLAASGADDAEDAEERTRSPQQHTDGPGDEERPEQRLPDGRRVLRENELLRRNGIGDEHGGQLAVDRDDAQGQGERERHTRQNEQTVEAVERLATEQQLEKEVEDRKADARFEAIYEKAVHGYPRFWRSMRSTSRRSSSTEIFSSSTKAETAPR